MDEIKVWKPRSLNPFDPVWKDAEKSMGNETTQPEDVIVENVLSSFSGYSNTKLKRASRMLKLGFSVGYTRKLLKLTPSAQSKLIWRKYPELLHCVKEYTGALRYEKLREILSIYERDKLFKRRPQRCPSISHQIGDNQEDAESIEMKPPQHWNNITQKAKKKKKSQKTNYHYHYPANGVSEHTNVSSFERNGEKNCNQVNEIYNWLNVLISSSRHEDVESPLELLTNERVSEIRVAIVPDGYPNNFCSLQEIKAVETDILIELAKQRKNSVKPQFTSCDLRSGWISIGCVDENTFHWLKFIIPQIKPWPAARMHVIRENEHPATLIFSGYFKNSSNIPTETILKLIEIANVGLETHYWRILNQTFFDSDVELEFRLDSLSAIKLKANSLIINYGSWQIVMKEKLPIIQSDPITKPPAPPRWPTRRCDENFESNTNEMFI